MIDFLSLVKDSRAYKIISSEKQIGTLSHAYLIISQDKESLDEYLKVFASLITCDDGNDDKSFRAKKLISEWAHPDVLKYPKKSQSVLSEDISDLIEQSYIKPLESDKKLFVISNGETMNSSAQNKLLKTLEEPPQNVYILIGATVEYNFLPTILSRVKKLEVPHFSEDKLFGALKEDCPDQEKLKRAIRCGDGTVGKALALYGDEKLSATIDYVTDMLSNMQSSKDVLEYSVKLSSLNVEFLEFLSVLELAMRDLLVAKNGRVELVKNQELYNRLSSVVGFNVGAINYVLDSINEAKKKKKANVNASVLSEWMLLKVLEGKFKWRKS